MHGKGVISASSEFCALHGKEGVICTEKERVISTSSVFQTVVHGSRCLRNLPPAMVSGCDRERERGCVCWGGGGGGGGYVCVCMFTTSTCVGVERCVVYMFSVYVYMHVSYVKAPFV